MAWIEVHQALANHRKMIRLAKSLGIKRPQAVGHLVLLWLWALDNAPSGSLADIPPEVVAEAAMWTRDPVLFGDALRDVGLIDSDQTLHDWWEYAGRLIQKRRQDADRKRTSRGHPSDIRVTAQVPNQPAPNQPNQPAPAPLRSLDVLPVEQAVRVVGEHEHLPRAIKAWMRQAPLTANATVQDELHARLQDRCPIEWIELACEEAGKQGGNKPWRYVEKILERYERQGHTQDTRKPPTDLQSVVVNGMNVSSGIDMASEADLEYDRKWKEAQRG